MRKIRSVVRRSRDVAVKAPGILRNIALSQLGIWPVGRIADARLRALPTYCINLDRATERRRLMAKQARDMGLQRFSILSAVDARHLSAEALIEEGLYDEAKAIAIHGRPLTLNEIAGSLSHAHVYDLMVLKCDPMALILEDDALFITRRLNRFRLSDVPADADIVFLNTFEDPQLRQPPVSGRLHGCESYTGSAAAYLLTLPGARKLAKVARPIFGAADGILGRVIAKSPSETNHSFKGIGTDTVLRAYMVSPDCVLNGSTCHYFGSYLPTGRNKAADATQGTGLLARLGLV